jgi:hypothetical protein
MSILCDADRDKKQIMPYLWLRIPRNSQSLEMDCYHPHPTFSISNFQVRGQADSNPDELPRTFEQVV